MTAQIALREAMTEHGLSIADVASLVKVSNDTVVSWRMGRKVPSGPRWQALRDHVPGFAERIDRASEVA